MVCPWLKKIIKHNFDTFVTCLLPHPPDFARVGGHWSVGVIFLIFIVLLLYNFLLGVIPLTLLQIYLQLVLNLFVGM